MKRIWAIYLRPYYGRMAVGLVIKFIGTIADLMLPWILADMIDKIIPKQDRGLIYIWGVLMVGCALIAVSFNIIANRMASKVARDTTETIRNDLFEKTMYLSERQIDYYTKPSLMARLTTDTYNIHQMLGRVQRLGVRAPILLIGGMMVTLTLDVGLALMLIAVMPFLAGVMYWVTKKSRPIYQQLQDAIDQFVRIVRDDILGIRVIKALSKEKVEGIRFDKVSKAVVAKEKAAGYTMAMIDPSVSLLMNMALVGVIGVGAYRVHHGLTEVGKILAFMTYFTIILNAMVSISKMLVIISKAIASAQRITQVLETPDEVVALDMKQNQGVNELEYLVFKSVSFQYPYHELSKSMTYIKEQIPHEQASYAALKDISFSLKKGQTLGILGGTGSGKTTLINLLLRFYEVSDGEILLEGQDIRTLPLDVLRHKFGVVFQNDVLFEGTIEDNVDFGRGLTKQQIQDALSYARAEEFVARKASEGSTKLNVKGANLSGGQKQRLLIARALAAHPEILILDDASSALDYQTDAMLRGELARHFKTTTKLIVAQRISSLMHADYIIVLEEGQMIGSGTHEELMASCEVYQAIYHTQLGGNLA